ncbi:MAG TPA: hypothetical protein ENI87_09315 [bacterium]|nr:hypothetical protein [bacterium]
MTGYGAPVAQPSDPAGHPTVVFLHGFGFLGQDYWALGELLAENGFAAVMLNTAQFSYAELEDDARAMFVALGNASGSASGFFAGAFDTSRVGLLGHSMGGAVTAYVLNEDPFSMASNPGYVCGLALAPANPAMTSAGTNVRVPLGIVSGLGDMVTPPSLHADPYYAGIATTDGLKFHYQMGLAAQHMNIPGLLPTSPTVFERTKAIVVGYFGHFLRRSLSGLDAVFGPDGAGDPNLSTLEVDVAVPQVWADQPLTIGQTTRVSIALEAGLAGLLGAGATSAPIPTMFGTVLIDLSTAFTVAESVASSERIDFTIDVPNDPLLVGVNLAVQGVGVTVSQPLFLGTALEFSVGQ